MENPSYYALLSSEVRYDNNLTDSEKLLYAEITALSNKYGYCIASNNYFSKLYNVHKVSISRRISNLYKYGHIDIYLIKENNAIKQRRIYPLTQIKGINTNVNTPINNNVNTPINTNVKDNNTSTNNTSINNNSASEDTQEHSDSKNIGQEFEEWWDLYDKKVDKKAARTKFKTARKQYSYETIVKGTKAYLKTIRDKQYQKYPKTFLYNETFAEEHIVNNGKGINDNESDEERLERVLGDL